MRLSVFWAIIVLAALAFFAVVAPNQQLEDVPISKVIERANSGKIEKIEGSGNELQITP